MADPLVQTAEGPVRGLVKDGVYEFLGIPYAAPPSAPLRWMRRRPSNTGMSRRRYEVCEPPAGR